MAVRVKTTSIRRTITADYIYIVRLCSCQQKLGYKGLQGIWPSRCYKKTNRRLHPRRCLILNVMRGKPSTLALYQPQRNVKLNRNPEVCWKYQLLCLVFQPPGQITLVLVIFEGLTFPMLIPQRAMLKSKHIARNSLTQNLCCRPTGFVGGPRGFEASNRQGMPQVTRPRATETSLKSQPSD